MRGATTPMGSSGWATRSRARAPCRCRFPPGGASSWLWRAGTTTLPSLSTAPSSGGAKTRSGSWAWARVAPRTTPPLPRSPGAPSLPRSPWGTRTPWPSRTRARSSDSVTTPGRSWAWARIGSVTSPRRSPLRSPSAAWCAAAPTPSASPSAASFTRGELTPSGSSGRATSPRARRPASSPSSTGRKSRTWPRAPRACSSS
mmetsp:Transcript_28605/g.91204  ORF Transcript_28605/g.91204 Transcript_28605/m.91204 type:complete len:201 (-) Transcript_28605:527-1129(-)